MSYISAIHTQDTVYVWERVNGERILKDYPAPYYLYYDDDEGKYRTIYDTSVSKAECKTRREFEALKRELGSGDIKLWESDIPPAFRILSSYYHNIPAPKLNITFLDIEVDYDPNIGFSSPANPYAPINSVALLHYWKNEIVVIVVPPEPGWDEERLAREVAEVAPEAPIPKEFKTRYVVCADEAELLLHLIQELQECDVLCGWNSDFFDTPYIVQRIARTLDHKTMSLDVTETVNPFSGKVDIKYNTDPNLVLQKCLHVKRLDFDTRLCTPSWKIVKTLAGKLMGHTVDFMGKIRTDYMDLYKKYEVSDKPSYKLEAISEAVLVDDKTGEPLLPKLKYTGSLAELYRKNFAYFVRYNVRDSEILGGFERKLGYVDVANQMYHMSTCHFGDVTGTLKLAEYALVNFCHHNIGRVVNNMVRPEIDRSIDGALVLYPQVGLHTMIGSIDINSLYPSGIRSLNISPETIRGQFTRDVKDFAELCKDSNELLSFVFEDSGEEVTLSASDWKKFFIAKKWAVSGYGTAFDQTKQGFIPALLADWYSTRKKYQAMSNQYDDAGDSEKANYYDRLQYVFKIKLNSLYGALTNLYFRFYDIRMGESTTGTGRVIVKHQCRKAAEVLGDPYDVDFPLYATVADAIEAGYSEEEADKIALHGSVFKGHHQASSIIYGDTDSTYFKTYAETVPEAIAIADFVAEQVNQSYPEFMRKTFLCTPGYDTIIKAGREIVSDRGIFVEKKRYIIHLVDKDGKACDKMKIMGLDTKKTTLPAHVSATLNGFIERFLKGDSWESISESIVDYKDALWNEPDILKIGLPKGIKGLEDYTLAYAADPACFLPGHVAASIQYNACLKEYNDKSSPEIKSGMKIKVFYMKHPNGRFKSIALPTDIEQIPDWFVEHFAVDRDAHVKRLVDNPLANILKAIDKTVPSKQSLFLDSLFEY